MHLTEKASKNFCCTNCNTFYPLENKRKLVSTVLSPFFPLKNVTEVIEATIFPTDGTAMSFPSSWVGAQWGSTSHTESLPGWNKRLRNLITVNQDALLVFPNDAKKALVTNFSTVGAMWFKISTYLFSPNNHQCAEGFQRKKTICYHEDFITNTITLQKHTEKGLQRAPRAFHSLK